VDVAIAAVANRAQTLVVVAAIAAAIAVTLSYH